jgi:hypothetical protein
MVRKADGERWLSPLYLFIFVYTNRPAFLMIIVNVAGEQISVPWLYKNRLNLIDPSPGDKPGGIG